MNTTSLASQRSSTGSIHEIQSVSGEGNGDPNITILPASASLVGGEHPITSNSRRGSRASSIASRVSDRTSNSHASTSGSKAEITHASSATGPKVVPSVIPVTEGDESGTLEIAVEDAEPETGETGDALLAVPPNPVMLADADFNIPLDPLTARRWEYAEKFGRYPPFYLRIEDLTREIAGKDSSKPPTPDEQLDELTGGMYLHVVDASKDASKWYKTLLPQRPSIRKNLESKIAGTPSSFEKGTWSPAEVPGALDNSNDPVIVLYESNGKPARAVFTKNEFGQWQMHQEVNGEVVSADGMTPEHFLKGLGYAEPLPFYTVRPKHDEDRFIDPPPNENLRHHQRSHDDPRHSLGALRQLVPSQAALVDDYSWKACLYSQKKALEKENAEKDDAVPNYIASDLEVRQRALSNYCIPGQAQPLLEEVAMEKDKFAENPDGAWQEECNALAKKGGLVFYRPATGTFETIMPDPTTDQPNRLTVLHQDGQRTPIDDGDVYTHIAENVGDGDTVRMWFPRAERQSFRKEYSNDQWNALGALSVFRKRTEGAISAPRWKQCLEAQEELLMTEHADDETYVVEQFEVVKKALEAYKPEEEGEPLLGGISMSFAEFETHAHDNQAVRRFNEMAQENGMLFLNRSSGKFEAILPDTRVGHDRALVVHFADGKTKALGNGNACEYIRSACARMDQRAEMLFYLNPTDATNLREAIS